MQAQVRRAGCFQAHRKNASRGVPSVKVFAQTTNSRTATLRRLLKEPGILQGPCCHDGLSARLIERAGFSYAFMSGFCTGGARLGAPDTGLISYAEMVDVGRNAHEATRTIPIIGDGDTGYGNALNVKRTVRGYAQAGFAGILIEDQIAPKSCGHVKGKKVTSREEAVARIRAAVDARNEGADILILARTDARQAVSLEEALWRAQAFAEAGADILFIDALESVEEMRAFCNLGGAAAKVPKMANMLEGGGKTPILSPAELERMGFKLVAYPLSLLGVSIRAMEQALVGLKSGTLPPTSDLGTFADIQAAVGFPEYYAEEARYAVSTPTPQSAPAQAPSPSQSSPSAAAGGYASGTTTSSSSSSYASSGMSSSSASSSSRSGSGAAQAASAASSPSSSSPAVEADAVIEAEVGLVSTSRPNSGEGGSGEEGRSSKRRLIRVRVLDTKKGQPPAVRLETRIPIGNLSYVLPMLPGMAGINVEAAVERALRERLAGRDPKGPLLTFGEGTDGLLEVYLDEE